MTTSEAIAKLEQAIDRARADIERWEITLHNLRGTAAHEAIEKHMKDSAKKPENL